MSLSLFIGKRYVTASRGEGSVSAFSIISIIGITLSMMALIIVMSVMNGVTSEVRDKILSMTAHTKIMSVTDGLPKDTDITPWIKDEKEVLAAAPFIEGQALIGIGHSYNGVQVKGIDPNTEANVADALADMGNELKTLTEGDFNVAIGQKLADKLRVSVGEKITIIVPKTTATAAGLVPRIKRFKVSAIFHSGHYLYDVGLILVNINDAARLFQRGDTIDGFQLKLDDLFKAQDLVKRLNATLPASMYSFDWTAQDKDYFEAVKAEKGAVFLILMIIMFVATFNILATLIMAVDNKRGDIAILRTIGMTPATIMRIFIIQGMTLNIIGTIIGIIGGVLFSLYIPDMMSFVEKVFDWKLPEQLYFISAIHPKIEVTFIAWVAFLSLLITFIFSLFPAYKAAKTQPARALAYE
ncbi:MAG: lipoprotein-releasing ABC transporter permease subunit [Gammaproteobacteria bacterium]|nr:lipoprotein-releasing ABC transporter permease subunit [Gammaproteobacteria bacterium]